MNTNFTKGINTAAKPIHTPEGYYPDAENMRNDKGSKRTEEGMKKLSAPDDFVQWGSCSIGDQTILLGRTSQGSIIASLSSADEWKIEVPARSIDVLGITEATQVVGKKNWAGERVIYFSTPAGSRRINLDTTLPTDNGDFDKVTSLFLEYDLPETECTGEVNTGTLGSGVYQFATRLVTESGASTAFGPVSGIYPVVPSSLQSTREFITGAPPQTATTKAISLKLSNIDNTFKYIQVGVLTYIGDANTPKITVTSLIPVNSQKTVTYTYRGTQDDLDTITIDEFIVSGLAYTTGKLVTQKDGTLLVGSPQEAEQPKVDWYRVARNITAEFIIKKIPYAEKLNFVTTDYGNKDKYSMVETSKTDMDGGYKNPLTCTLFKGYRRKEVYSFTLTPVYKSGVLGPTVHIPAPGTGGSQIPAANITADSGTLGTFVSEEKYPENDMYPGLTTNDGLRLHRFPDADLQPIVEGNVETSNLKIRVLGVKFGNIKLDPSEADQESLIAGYIIGRVNRTGNETQLAQGIVRPHCNVLYGGKLWGRTTMLGDGFGRFNNFPDKRSSSYRGEIQAGSQDLTSFNFLAPDIIHKLYSTSQGTHLKQHSVYKADPYACPLINVQNDNPGPEDYGIARPVFKNITGISTAIINRTPIEIEGNRNLIPPVGVPYASESLGGKINYGFVKDSENIQVCSTDGMLWLTTVNDTPIHYLNYNVPIYMSKQVVDGDERQSIQQIYKMLPEGSRVDFILHSLESEDPKQYGSLYQMTSMFVDYVDWKTSQAANGTVEFFNGDTFINKYGLTINDEGPFPWPTPDRGDTPNAIGRMRAGGLNAIVYFWLESNNNYAYRHFFETESFSETNVNESNGSTPFFPAYKQLASMKLPFGILSMKGENWSRPGYARQLNNQYSAQSTIKPYVITPKEDVDKKASLVNRIIYSAQAVQGEKADAYQIFLPNNYYDVPQEYGDLTDVYVNQELYASTAQVQWQLFYNTLATQVTSVGQVVLGTGGAFNRPAVPMTTVSGGYGGTSHWTHATNTVFGRIFVDKLQGMFFTQKEGLEVISRDLKIENKQLVQALSNSDIFVGSEPLRNRAFIQTGSTMWSYDLEEGAFVSRHTYKPRWMFSHGPHMYLNNSNSANGSRGIFKHSAGVTGVFFGVLHPSSITIAVNTEPITTKLFRSLGIITKRTTEAGLNIPLSTFNQIQAWNMERNTGLLDINPKMNSFQQPKIMEVLSSKVNDTFRILMPRDIVVDPAKDIFAVGNHAQRRGDAIPAKWLPRMRGTYIELKLITNNTQGPLYIHNVMVEADLNIR